MAVFPGPPTGDLRENCGTVTCRWLLAVSYWPSLLTAKSKWPMAKTMRDFRKLECWHLGMELVEIIYQLVKKLPVEERFGLRSQMTKAVISMPSNIAEGCSRNSNKESVHFFEISIGSAFELETQLLAGYKIGYFSKEDIAPILPKVNLFQKKTNNYRISMKSS